MTRPVITLTTDFGTADGFVGAMKGVILALAPGATIVDVTHDVPRHDVVAAAFAIEQAASCFARGSVHVVVVDPGVGSARQGVVVKARGRLYVGPDNGVFDRVVAGAGKGGVAAWEITSRRFRRAQVSPTFHGRDVFAPTAARLARGVRPALAGAAVALVGGGSGAGSTVGGRGVGRVIHVDHFGNLITSVPAGVAAVRVAGHDLPVHTTYAEVAVGALVAYTGSAGTIEIAVRDGSAAERLGLGRDALVEAIGP